MSLPNYSYCWLVRGVDVEEFSLDLIQKASKVHLNGHVCFIDEISVGINLQGNCYQELTMCAVLNRLMRYYNSRNMDVRMDVPTLIEEVTEEGFTLKPLDESVFRHAE